MRKRDNIHLQDNEDIKRYELQHWIVPMRATVGFGVFFAIAVFIFWGGFQSVDNFEIPAKVIMLFGYATALVAIHWFMIMIFRYLNSRTYITNIRIINFNAVPMVADDITYILIDEIHEIEEHKHGLIKNILNYGNISINLPAMPNAIDLRDMHHPEKIVDFVEGIRRDRSLRKKNGGDTEKVLVSF